MAGLLQCLVDAPATLSPGNTVFTNTSGWGSVASATETDQSVTVRSAGTYSRLMCVVGTSGTSTITLRFRKNTANGVQSVSVGASVTGSFFENDDHDDVVATDKISLSWTLGAGVSPVVTSASVLFNATTNSARRLICTGSFSTSSASTTTFNGLEGSIASTASTEAQIQFKATKSATAKNLYVNVKTKGRAQATTVAFRKGGVSSPTVSLTGTGIFEETATSISIASTNLCNYLVTTGTSTGTDVYTTIAVDWQTTDSSTIYPTDLVGTGSIGLNVTRFCDVMGAGTANATESVVQDTVSAWGMLASGLQCEVSANTVSAASTIRFRINAANGNQTASITSSTTGIFQDTTHTDSIKNGDLICASIVTGGSGTALTAASFGFTAVDISLTNLITGEQIPFADFTPNERFEYQLTVNNQSITFTDAVATALAVSLTKSITGEQISFGDAFSSQLAVALTLAVSDSISFSDAISTNLAVAGALTLALNDGFAWTDAGVGRVQSAAAEGSAVSSLDVTLPKANTLGNTIIVAVRMSTTTQTVTVADTAGNTYVDDIGAENQVTDSHQIHVFYAKNIKAAAAGNVVTATFSLSNAHPWVAAFEYSGLDTTAPLDKFVANQSSSAVIQATVPALTVPNELRFTVIGLPNSSIEPLPQVDVNAIVPLPDTIAENAPGGLARAGVKEVITTGTASFTEHYTTANSVSWSIISASFQTALSSSFDSTLAVSSGALALAVSDSIAFTDAIATGVGLALTDVVAFSDVVQTGFGLALTDTLALTDAFARTLVGVLTLAITGEQVSFTDNFAPALVALLTLSITGEQISFTDGIVTGLGLALNDTITFTDSIKIGTGLALADSLAFSDSIALVEDYELALTDSWSFSDSFASNLGVAVALADSFSFIDSIKLNVGFVQALSDSWSFTDSIAINEEIELALSDSLVFSDSARIGYGIATNETLVFSDSVTTVVGIQVALSDSWTFSDSIAFTIGLVLTPADTLAISDSIQIGYGSALSDAVIFTDSLTNVIGYLVSLSDSWTFSDNLQTVLVGVLTQALSDSFSFSDSIALVTGVPLLVSDTLTLTDTVAVTYASLLAVSDTLSVSDSIQIGFAGALTDALSLSDTLAGRLDYFLSVNDSFVLTDTFNFSSNAPGISLNLVDSFTFSDSLVIGTGLAITEAVVFTDSIVTGLGLNIKGDAVSFTDAVVRTPGVERLFADSFTFTDSIKTGIGIALSDTASFSDGDTLVAKFVYLLAISDLVVFADAEDAVLGVSLKVSDSFTFTDFEDETLGISKPLSDSFTISDSIKTGYGSTLADTVILTDSLASTVGYLLNLDDQIVFDDSAQELLATRLSLSDSVIFSDSLQVGLGIALVDSFAFLDSIQLTVGTNALTLSVSDSIAFADSITTELHSGNTQSVADTVALADSIATMLGISLPVSDQFSFSDVLVAMVGVQLAIGDTVLWQDFLSVLNQYCLALQDSDNVWSDEMRVTLGAYLRLADTIAWTDEIIAVTVFAITLLLQDEYASKWLDNILFKLGHGLGPIDLRQLGVDKLIQLTTVVGKPVQLRNLHVDKEIDMKVEVDK